MSSIVRVIGVKINNLKNVKRGRFQTNSSFENHQKADVVGFYGQNGSGKTAVVEAFRLLKILLTSENNKLPEVSKHLIYFNEKILDLSFEFIVDNKYGQFFVRYDVSLCSDEENLQVCKEKISYRENLKNKRYKVIMSKNEDAITIRTESIKSMNEDGKVSVMVANKMASKNATSFVFRDELKESLDLYLNETEISIVEALTIDFDRDFHVIMATNYGLLAANIIMPFSIHIENKRGNIPYEMQDTMILPSEVFETIEKVIEQTNIVLKTIIPGLQIKTKIIHNQKMEDGGDGVRFEFLSVKKDVELPLRCESEGVLKIISILTTLIAVYNKPNACVVIDELDAGIFEFLLGELLEVISDNGQGQLIFTSHNLRILEVLPIQNLWFTTLNEKDRYLQLKGVKKSNNARDIYLRAVQLGGQDELMYDETDSFDIKKSFRKAGFPNGE